MDRDISLDHMEQPDSQCPMLGDFNGHSEAWGYTEADRRGEEVEDWQIDNKLLLLNDIDDPPTFFLRQWLTSTTPNLALATKDKSRKATLTILSQPGGNDHKPVLITLDLHYKPQAVKLSQGGTIKKSKLEMLSSLTDQYVTRICHKTQPLNQKMKDFNHAILKAAKETIPCGANRNYRP